MKLKPLVLAVSMAATSTFAEVRHVDEVQPQGVHEVRVIKTQHVHQIENGQRLAPVVNVMPVLHAQSYPQTTQVCRQESIPIYRNVPVTTVTETINSREEVLGTIVGAVIGSVVTGGTSTTRIGGAILGGSVGYVLSNKPSRTTTIHGYTQEFVGYRDIQKCEVVSGSYEKQVVIGYSVTYNENGILKTITMAQHPGEYVRVQ